MEHWFIFCSTCKHRQSLKSLKDATLAKFIRAHNKHIIFLETAEKMRFDLLVYNDEWKQVPRSIDKIKEPDSISNICDTIRQRLVEEESKRREIQMAYYDLRLALAKEEKEIKSISEGLKESYKEAVKAGERVAIHDAIIFTEEEQLELEKLSNERLTNLPKEIQEAIGAIKIG